MFFEGANRATELPGKEDLKNKINTGATREKDWMVGSEGVSGLVKFAESPALG